MDNTKTFEVIIVGAGIAGASAAYFLTRRGVTNVLILEREDQPGYHATGRSAAVLVELDPVLSVLEIKLLAAPFLRNPPEGFCETPILRPNGILAMFENQMWDLVQQFVPGMESASVNVNLLTPSEVVKMIPVVNAGHMDGAIWLPDDGHLEVHELLWGYLRYARRRGAELNCGIEVTGIIIEKGQCRGVVTDKGEFRSRWVINAAGAWAGVVGRMAGTMAVELTPKRRTVITFASPEGLDTESWPLVANYSRHLYFAPESGGMMASPMDEDPMEPYDARPDDLTVAQTVDRMETLTPRLVPKTIRQKWAGLRTFSPDQGFVIGEDPLIKGFFWLAGLGGAGIETSPAAGQIAADLIAKGWTDLIDTALISPCRFAE